MSQPVRIATVGLGWVGTHRHLPALLADNAFRVVGVVDRHGEKARVVGERLGVRHYGGDRLADIPWLDEVDAFTVATAPMSHGALIREALELGRHVLTEKPFVMDPAEGQSLVTAARERRLILAVVHNFQFARSTRELFADVQGGRYGTLRFVHARQLGNPQRRLPAWYDELPFGLFYDESPHMFYLLRALAPAPLEFERAEAVRSTLGKSTPAWISVHYRAGPLRVPVKLDMAFEAPLSEWHIGVGGDRSFGDLDVFRDIYVRLPNDGVHSTWPVLRTSLFATWQHWRQHLISGPRHLSGSLLYGNDEVFRRFAVAAASGMPPAGIAAEDALAVLRMQHEVLAGAGWPGR